MGKAKRKKKQPVDHRIAPTNEAFQHGDFASAGMAYNRIPVIASMHKRGMLNDAEVLALGYFRDQASIADRSEMRSCLDRSVSGGERGPSVAVVSAQLETARMERDLGQLVYIARAIAVKDVSLSQWCIGQHGGRERYDGKGKFVAMVPVCELRVMRMALQDLKMAAHRITR